MYEILCMAVNDNNWCIVFKFTRKTDAEKSCNFKCTPRARSSLTQKCPQKWVDFWKIRKLILSEKGDSFIFELKICTTHQNVRLNEYFRLILKYMIFDIYEKIWASIFEIWKCEIQHYSRSRALLRKILILVTY